ncbi:MAG: UDP-3-O-(3-hydroxymyristoyl)glucosamine N-acyltransferase [Gammaproteobacteria bacterium]|uniref:UDP-3-O-acylglucosamine N-acyltransferase n=1 Tax=Candidatus Thiopontia autotrophica TaxID=2841688 RepID=A0A8J6P0W1_9GAMM|nr:UDP-3-O-(3-hydroxymyristoyl)glucosamine N-acyltransferase [Candidatus Thiopontia autotrophica]MBL6968916.1 UDP-3-O-(3-hydroxymyristoyl)glucosamine N-acyltransferase [Gammaproteobacteria bacterium]
MGTTLGEIAELINAELVGDSACVVEEIAALEGATSNQISFLSSDKFLSQLQSTEAAAVILHQDRRDQFDGNRLLMDDPYLGYAKVASILNPYIFKEQGRSPSATIHETASIAEGGWIGPQCVVMEQVEVGESVFVGAGSVIEEGCTIGRGSRLMANVSLMAGTVVGEDCIIHPGAVLGSDGFGFANEDGRWVKIPQLGRVIVGDGVEIGANSTIDRGALEDTVIESGVKIDNLVHIAHNVRVGENSAMAAMVGIAGSTVIGAGCTFGGQAGVVGHLEIVDGTHCTARTLITKSINTPGLYSSATPADPNRKWRRNVVQFRKLDESIRELRGLAPRLSDMEEKIELMEKGKEK